MKKKIDQNILKNLKSENEQVVMSAIKDLRNKGNHLYIKELIGLLSRTDKDVVKSELLALLNDLCDNDVVPEIISEIHNDANEKVLHLLVSSCWQSRLDYTEYFSDFVSIALSSDYITTIEAISVIENILMNGKTDGLTISNELFKVKENLKNCQEDRKPLIQELEKILTNK